MVNSPYICSNISESPAYCVYISQHMKYARACSLCVDFIDRERILTKKLVDEGYTLEKLKNKLTTLQYSPLAVFVWWWVLHTPDLTSPDMTGYALDSLAGAWPQQVKLTLPYHLFTRLFFPESVSVLSWV